MQKLAHRRARVFAFGGICRAQLRAQPDAVDDMLNACRFQP
jgi:hypothetical protein